MVMRLGWRLKLPAASAGFLLLAGFCQLLTVCAGRAEDGFPGAADYSQSWQVTSYSKDAGISRQRFFDIAFSPDGTVLLAADDGLRRFDGFT